MNDLVDFDKSTEITDKIGLCCLCQNYEKDMLNVTRQIRLNVNGINNIDIICSKCYDYCMAYIVIKKNIKEHRHDQYLFTKRCKIDSKRNKLFYQDIMMYCIKNCPICGVLLNYKKHRLGGNATLDRIIPGDKGGEYVNDNIAVICNICNTMKGSKTVQDVYNNINKRRLIAYLQGLSYPNNLKRMMSIYNWLSKKDCPDVIPDVKSTSKNVFVKHNDIWFIVLKKNNRYKNGDKLFVDTKHGRVKQQISLKHDNLCIPLGNNEIKKPCIKCKNVIYYINIKKHTKHSKYKYTKITTCLLCNRHSKKKLKNQPKLV